MGATWIKRATWTVVLGLFTAGLVWFAWPQPMLVDLAIVSGGPMEVTVTDQGKAEVRHVYTVSAPVAGKVLRISLPPNQEGVSRHVGDQVVANKTIVAVMRPMAPGFLSFRLREETEAAVAAASAAVQYAEAETSRLEAAVAFYRAEFERTQALARTQSASAEALDKAKFEIASNQASLTSAKAQVQAWQSVRAALTARLLGPSSSAPAANPDCCIQLRAPASGRVLKVVQQSEAVVPAGAPLIEIGNPLDLKVVADLLSADAVRIRVGAPVRIDGWGGPPLNGRVRRIDPAGFLKVSALGIDEQRVHVVIDLVDPPQMWSRLGHDYRVTVHIRVWSDDNALTVPVGALFRKGEDWAVFSVKDRRARTTTIKIGHRNNQVAEVTSGLAVGDQVILYPSDRISDGTRVAQR